MAKNLCYNRGCGQQYEPDNNKPDQCTYHPGTPVFHDAYKGWSCCTKKTTNFTEFLNIKGCTKGCHSNVKPVQIEKPTVTNDKVTEGEEAALLRKPQVFMARPSGDAALERLKFSTAPSLSNELAKVKNTLNSNQDTNQGSELAIGTSCKNGGCRKTFEKEIDHIETCMHHSGTPVFHEGMKYWTCCIRKTSDFNSFLEQEGCTVGKHIWLKVKSGEELKQSCRYDWFQTASDVYLNVYAKIPIPEESLVEANSVKLKVHVAFGADKNIFDLALNLYGIADVAGSSVLYTSNKVEVRLKKAEPMSWSFFALPDAKLDVKIVDETNVDIGSLILE